MSHSSKDDPIDLSDLVNKASDAVEVKAAQARTRIDRGGPLRRLLPVFSGVLILTCGLWAAERLWHHWAPYAEEKFIGDFVAVVEQARDAIEESKRVNGELPQQIPNAALASVVRYQQMDGNYQLWVDGKGVVTYLDDDGRVKTVKVEKEKQP
jgi:hypothetical protein